MAFEILEPVLNKDNEPCWLINTGKKKFTANSNRTIKEIIQNNNEVESTPVFELKPEGLWQCKKCGAYIQNIQDKPVECTECERTSNFIPITDIITGDISNLWKIPYWVDIPQQDIDMLDVYHNLNRLSTKCLIFPEEVHYKIYNLSIISTYHYDVWESSGWLLFLALHDSGKTKALDFFSEVGYRIVHGGSGITFPAMVRANHYYNAGILIDQAETKLNQNTETGREMLGFVLPGYRKRSKYVVAHKEDQKKTMAYNNFGFKAFASERAFNPALTSRCIPFYMERDYPEIAKLSTVQNDLNDIQTKLINYKYKFNKPIELDNHFEIKGRIREIFEPIIATGKHIGIDVSDVIKFAQDMEKEKEEELQGTIEWEILNAIKGSEENERLLDAPEEISFKDLCLSIGWDYERKVGQKIGYILNKKLLLKTKRKREGTVLLLNDSKNDRRLKYLYKRYKV